jgi:FAD/FMN-containing dehydrogenase
MLAAVDDIETARALLAALRRELGSLDSIEVMWPEAVELVAAHLGATPPVAVAPRAASRCWSSAPITSIRPPTCTPYSRRTTVSGPRRSRRADPARTTAGVPRPDHRGDRRRGVRVRNPDVQARRRRAGRSIEQVLDVARLAAERQRARLIPFGHLAEGNLHLNFLDAAAPEQIADAVLPVVADLGGTISAEHGVGVAKTRWLHLVRSDGDLAAQRSIRRALDPGGS